MILDLASPEGEGRKSFEGKRRVMRLGFLAVLFLPGCASPGRDLGFSPGDFALLEFTLGDCTSNERHLGLEKFLRSVFSTDPQIDLDRQLARVRLVSPVTLDFARLAEGFRKANTGLGEIRITAQTTLMPDSVMLLPTGQTFPSAQARVADPEPKLRTLRFSSWQKEMYPRADLDP